MMTKEQLAEIKERLAAATPGPWCSTAYHEDEHGPHIENEDEITVAVCSLSVPEHRANGSLIAYAPEDIAAMLAEIERLQTSAKANEEHCAAVERMVQDYMRRYGVL